jgi:hypothetical protein
VAVAFPITDIQERVRDRCDLPVYTANTKITTAAILRYVHASARELSGILEDGDWHFVATTPLVTVAGVATVALPLNFSQLVRLCWLRGAGDVLVLEPANLEGVHPRLNGQTWDATRPRYRITGDKLEFFPPPDAVHSLELRYSSGAFIASAADTLMGQIGWDTWIIYNCCCLVKQRAGEDYAAFSAERERIEQKIKNKRKDPHGIVQPRDVASAAALYERHSFWWRG